MNKYAREPERVVDLHGYTTLQAREFLDEFFENTNYKHIRLITGKGLYKDGPILRSYIEKYLRLREIKFQYAKISDGGEGALEVFLE
jgi:DNA-nicking Smr family endonuclease